MKRPLVVMEPGEGTKFWAAVNGTTAWDLFVDALTGGTLLEVVDQEGQVWTVFVHTREYPPGKRRARVNTFGFKTVGEPR